MLFGVWKNGLKLVVSTVRQIASRESQSGFQYPLFTRRGRADFLLSLVDHLFLSTGGINCFLDVFIVMIVEYPYGIFIIAFNDGLTVVSQSRSYGAFVRLGLRSLSLHQFF